MNLNPDSYSLNEITNFFNLNPNHTFTQINNAFRRKHNEVTVTPNLTADEKDNMCAFFDQLKNKLVLNLSTSNVSHNEFNKGSKITINNEKIDDHVDTVTNNQIIYPTGTSKEISAGIMNPIERHILKNLVHIDTRFKQNYVIEGETKFTFKMPTSFKNVVGVKLNSFEPPSFIYNFTKQLSNTKFVVNCTNGSVVAGTDTTVEIDEGKYTKATLRAEIQAKLISKVDADFVVIEDVDSGLITIRNTTNANTFTLKFDGINNKLNLGYILGYRYDKANSSVTNNANGSKTYNVTSVNDATNNRNNAVADKIPDMGFNDYYYLSLNDYQGSANQPHYAVMNNNFITKNIFAKLKNKADDSNTDYFIKKKYFGPVTLERVTFELLDKYGNKLDLKGCDYSFSLELDILYKY